MHVVPDISASSISAQKSAPTTAQLGQSGRASGSMGTPLRYAVVISPMHHGRVNTILDNSTTMVSTLQRTTSNNPQPLISVMSSKLSESNQTSILGFASVNWLFNIRASAAAPSL